MTSSTVGREKVAVVTRVRPVLPEEGPCDVCVTQIDEATVCVGHQRIFSTDSVAGPATTTEDVFKLHALPLVQAFVESGTNATLLAYGQTGAGKTYTMEGVAPLALRYIFAHLAETFLVSYIEVYGDKLFDLLSVETAVAAAAAASSGQSEQPQLAATGNAVHVAGAAAAGFASRRGLQLLDDGGCPRVIGAEVVKVSTLDDAVEALRLGSLARATASTNMNMQSSRSHALFTLTSSTTRAKLTLVDLAGSERNKKTLNVGARFKESVGINTGLLALGNVIRALSTASVASHYNRPALKAKLLPFQVNSNQKQAAKASANPHIPYRSSKLTRLLQDSLGGTSKTLFIACIAPHSTNMDETIRTLQYASKASHILNEPLPYLERMKRDQYGDLLGPSPESNGAGDRHGEGGDAEPRHRGGGGGTDAELTRRHQAALEVQSLRDEVSSLRQELSQAQLYLDRDVEVFREKLKTIKSLKKQNSELTEQLRASEEREKALMEKLSQMKEPTTTKKLQSQFEGHFNQQLASTTGGLEVVKKQYWGTTLHSQTCNIAAQQENDDEVAQGQVHAGSFGSTPSGKMFRGDALTTPQKQIAGLTSGAAAMPTNAAKVSHSSTPAASHKMGNSPSAIYPVPGASPNGCIQSNNNSDVISEALEKDNVYYRHMNTQLRDKLQTLLSDNEKLTKKNSLLILEMSQFQETRQENSVLRSDLRKAEDYISHVVQAKY